MLKYKLTDKYKQIKEENDNLPIIHYKVYCDMDGVIADFEEYFKITNPEHLTTKEYVNKYGIDAFWNFIDIDNGVKFWENIPWTSDGKQLWEYIKKYEPSLLSSPSRNNASRLGKRRWVQKHIPGTTLILSPAPHKQNYSKKNHILIDDRQDNIEQWRSKGGIGILHKNTQDTIKQLQEYGL